MRDWGYSNILIHSQLAHPAFLKGSAIAYLVVRGFFLMIARLFGAGTGVPSLSLSPPPAPGPGPGVLSLLPILTPILFLLLSLALAAMSNGILLLREGPAWGELVA